MRHAFFALVVLVAIPTTLSAQSADEIRQQGASPTHSLLKNEAYRAAKRSDKVTMALASLHAQGYAIFR